MPDVVAAPANAIPTALIAKLVLGGVVVAAAVVAGYFLMQTPTPVPAPSPPKYSPPTLIPPIPISPPVSGQPLQAMSTPFKDLITHSKEPWCQCNKQPSQHTQQRQCSQCLPPSARSTFGAGSTSGAHACTGSGARRACSTLGARACSHTGARSGQKFGGMVKNRQRC